MLVEVYSAKFDTDMEAECVFDECRQALEHAGQGFGVSLARCFGYPPAYVTVTVPAGTDLTGYVKVPMELKATHRMPGTEEEAAHEAD